MHFDAYHSTDSTGIQFFLFFFYKRQILTSMAWNCTKFSMQSIWYKMLHWFNFCAYNSSSGIAMLIFQVLWLGIVQSQTYKILTIRNNIHWICEYIRGLYRPRSAWEMIFLTASLDYKKQMKTNNIARQSVPTTTTTKKKMKFSNLAWR